MGIEVVSVINWEVVTLINNKKINLLISLICLTLFLFPTFTSAHAYIVKSNPSDNEILKQSPKKIFIQFDETIQSVNNSIQVYNDKGKRVDQKNGHVNAKNSTILECGLNSKLPNGTYRIQWKAVSNDGHPVQGVIPFQIGSDSAVQDGTAIEAKSEGYTPQSDLIIIRWLQYFSNASYIGALFFLLLILQKDLVQNGYVKKAFKKILNYSLLLLFLSIIVSLPLMASIELTTSWKQVLNIETLKDMITNSAYGKTWLIQVGGLILLLIFTYLLHVKSKSLLYWISFIIGVGLILTKALTSHAASTTNVLLTVGMDFLHLLSASIWIGSLVVFVALLPLSRKVDTKNHYLEMIRRFSKWGIIILLVLTATGIFGSLLYIPSLRSLITTDYGRTLLGKVILLVIMIIFAAVNFTKGKRKSEKGVSPSLWGELLAGIIVLVLSVILTNLPTAMASPGPIKESKTVNQGSKITFEATPNVIGKNTFAIDLKDRNGQPMKNIEQVVLTFTCQEMDMGEDTKTLLKVKEGKYEGMGMNFNMAGNWNVHVHVLTKDFETLDTDFKVMVGSQ